MVKVELLDKPESPPAVSTPPTKRTPPKTKVVEKEVEVEIDRFDKQEYTDLQDAVDQYLRTYNNPTRKIKPDGKVDRANKRMLKLKDKLKKILN